MVIVVIVSSFMVILTPRTGLSVSYQSLIVVSSEHDNAADGDYNCTFTNEFTGSYHIPELNCCYF